MYLDSNRFISSRYSTGNNMKNTEKNNWKESESDIKENQRTIEKLIRLELKSISRENISIKSFKLF